MVPALIAAALILGAAAGWIARMHTAHDRYLAGMAARYRAQEAWLETRTAEMMAEVEREARQVTAELKNRRTAGGKTKGGGNGTEKD